MQMSVLDELVKQLQKATVTSLLLLVVIDTLLVGNIVYSSFYTFILTPFKLYSLVFIYFQIIVACLIQSLKFKGEE
jgi:hypothetical protein